MAYFLHYAPQAGFEQGIFMPFATAVDAERQAAMDWAGGADDDLIEQIFEAPYDPPKRGYLHLASRFNVDDEIPHLNEKNWKKVSTRAQLKKKAPKHQQDMYDEMVKAQADYLLEVQKAIQTGAHLKNAVPGNAYVWMTGGTATATQAALAAATAKTVVYIVSSTANQPAIVEIGVSFDGVTASAVPVLVELISSTTGTAGTPRAALAAGKQLRGWPAQTSQTTAADTYSAEPGTSLVNRKWYVSPNGGLWVMQFPLGREPTGIVTATTDGKAWGLRLTAPATVNAHAYIEWEE